MKKLKTIILVAASAAVMYACNTSKSAVTYDGKISTAELEMINYPLADTILKYSMDGFKDWKLTKQMDDLGNEIAANLRQKATVLQLGQGVLVSMDRGDLYRTGEYTMNDDMKATLRSLIYNLKQNPETFVIVFGRTDAIGSQDYNDKLGYLRAAVVANYMKEYGIDEDRLFVDSYGERYPDFFNFYPEGRDKNRRVDVLIIPSNEVRTDQAR